VHAGGAGGVQVYLGGVVHGGIPGGCPGTSSTLLYPIYPCFTRRGSLEGASRALRVRSEVHGRVPRGLSVEVSDILFKECARGVKSVRTCRILLLGQLPKNPLELS